MQTIFGDGSNQKGGIMDALVGAGKRLLTDLRREHPHLKLIVIEDACQAHGAE